MSMVERVAKAMRGSAETFADQWKNPLHAEDRPLTPADCPYSVMATAAIEEMRELSEDGLDAFARAFGWAPFTNAGRENARYAWQAMIDSALSPEPSLDTPSSIR